MAKTVSLRAYARHRGVNLSAVQKAISSGRITPTTSGKIDPAIADKQWTETTDASKQRDTAGPMLDPAASNSATAFAKARAVRETFQAKLAQITYEEKIGKLVSSDQVKVEAFDLARVVRDSILNIPNRISSELASITDPIEVDRRLTAELVRALEELANAGRRRADV